LYGLQLVKALSFHNFQGYSLSLCGARAGFNITGWAVCFVFDGGVPECYV
jgi:hypothetical protein